MDLTKYSDNHQSLSEREAARIQWKEQQGWADAKEEALPVDASFRRYYRWLKADSNETVIVMDAPPALEPIRPFILVAEWLVSKGLSAPRVMAVNEEQGWLLLEDLGSDRYANWLQACPATTRYEEELTLYQAAINVLVELHQGELPTGIERYTADILMKEAELMLEWYIPILDGQPLSADIYEQYRSIWSQLWSYVVTLPEVPVLRDYHAENLMWLPDRHFLQCVGLLDFQDALIGCPAYDLVSLLEDARRDISNKLADDMVTYYLQTMSSFNRRDFLAAYAVLGAQRNCKIIGIFARKAIRDGNSKYLALLPRVFRYLEKDLRHPLLAPLKQWMDKVIPNRPQSAEVSSSNHETLWA
jgi:aminoglycoside/choline kinase family phosphotransferase